jgi:hypothetical protein
VSDIEVLVVANTVHKYHLTAWFSKIPTLTAALVGCWLPIATWA